MIYLKQEPKSSAKIANCRSQKILLFKTMADKTDDDAEAVVKRPKQHPPSQNKPSKYKRGQNVDYKVCSRD